MNIEDRQNLTDMLRTLYVITRTIESMLREKCDCVNWDSGRNECGLYKQRPPEHVIKSPGKYCKDWDTIPF